MGKAISGLLRREFRFLHKPLNIWSRLLLLAAAVTIGVSLFFPLWKMHLVAPQYSDGLDLYIFPYKIQGGGLNGQHLNEINGLNHYIGMKPIQAADFMEMRWMPFVFGLIILMTLRSVVFGEMSNVVDLFAALLVLRRLLHRLVLVPTLRIRTQSRSARANAHQAVHADADRSETNRELPRSTVIPGRRVSAVPVGVADCAGRLVFKKGDRPA